MQLNRAKTRIWNAAGEEPANIGDLRPVGGDPVWVGDWALPRDQQGLRVLGTPLGSEAFVRNQLVLKREAHDRLLHAIPAVEDLQAAWLLLRYCAAPRANYLLRVLSHAATADYAASTTQTAQLAARFGGLGLRSALSDCHAAHWASWCDALPVLWDRAPKAALLTARRQLRLPSTRQFTSAHKATQYLTGRKPCGPLLMPPAARNHVTTSVDGSAVLPTPVTSPRLRRFFRAFHLQLERCCCHRPGHIPRVPSRFYPHMRTSHSPVRTSVFFSFAGCACRSHLHRGLALAAGRLMCLMITGRRVPPPSSLPRAPSPLSAHLPGCAARLARVWPGMCAWLI